MCCCQIRAEEDLKKAVAEERYEDAARLQQVLKDVGKPPDSQMEKKLSNLAGMKKEDDNTIKPYSDTTTNGVRVRVDSFYIADQSTPADGRFLFGYNVTVTNCNRPSARPCCIRAGMLPHEGGICFR